MIQEEINNAITAHGKWKTKLRQIIDSGESDVTVEHVEKDNNCSFGKWLHERIEDKHKSDPYYSKIVQLHAEFHKLAAEVMHYGLMGDKDTANDKISINSQFTQKSAELTRELQNWLASIG